MNISRGKGKELAEVCLSWFIISTVKDKSSESAEEFQGFFMQLGC